MHIRACQKIYKLEAWQDKYVLKDNNQNFKIVSSGPIDHDTGLYKFVGFNSTKRQPFYVKFQEFKSFAEKIW
jgi:hypothetical protein